MNAFDTWLATHGATFAGRVDQSRDDICASVTQALMEHYPDLCYDPSRPDAAAFQQLTYTKTPQRFHKVLLAALRFNSLSIIEREYRWSWKILPRYGVQQEHVLNQARWYFEALREYVPEQGDAAQIERLEIAVVQMIRRGTEMADPFERTTARSRPRRSAV